VQSHRFSRTAVKIGRAVVYVAQDPRLRPLLPAGAAELTERLMLEAGVLRPWHVTWSRNPAFRGYVAFLERQLVPGMALHIGLRKRFFDDETRLALAEGAAQVLVVGAGFDTLALRLAAEFRDTPFVELDHPTTQEVKRAAAEAAGALRPNYHLLGADLASASLERLLAGLGSWRQDVASVVVAEGLLCYLAEKDIAELLRAVRRGTAPGSRLLFSFLEHDEAGRPRVGKLGSLTRRTFVRLGEPLLWSLPEGGLQAFLEAHGYRLCVPPERCDLRRRYLEPAGLGDLPLGEIELLAVAETAGGWRSSRPRTLQFLH
jgi:methyltransferase (TIGR00027 family)